MQDPSFVHAAFSAIAARYVSTNHVLSLGIDILWRKRVSELVSERQPVSVLDVATGTGDLALEIQQCCPEARVVGADFCGAMLKHAIQRGVRHVVEADALALPFEDNSFAALTVAFGLRNMASWPKAIQEFRRVLKPDGFLLVLDFSLPGGRLLGSCYEFYLDKIMPAIAGKLTGCPEAYSYLAKSIQEFPSGEKMNHLIGSQGFEAVQAEPLNGGIATIYTGFKGQ